MPVGKGYEDAGNKIRATFLAGWVVAGPLERTPIAWDNGKYVPVVGTAWGRFSILDGESEQTDMGPVPRIRHIGLVAVEIYVPAAKLDAVARGHADAAAAIFRRLTLTTGAGDLIQFRTPHYRAVGVEGPWYHANLLIPFYRDSIFS
jgi:hypothetical protein